jgi:hypothetical protein
MPLEIADYINGLDAANPTGTDPKSQGDDHARLIKKALKATFPALTAPVTATAAQLNTAALTPWVRQGGGVGQLTNTVYIGWNGAKLALQVDTTDFGINWPINAQAATSGKDGYFSITSAAGPMLELHKPGFMAGAWYINNVNQLVFGQTNGAASILGERLTLNINTGDMTLQGTLTQSSDERLKTDWRPVAANFLASLANVKAGIYTRIDNGTLQAGVSAQSLRAVLPEAVQADEKGMLSVAYANAALVACIALAKEVTALRVELNALKARA